MTTPLRCGRVTSQPDVAWLHIRSAVAQCFTFEVRPG